MSKIVYLLPPFVQGAKGELVDAPTKGYFAVQNQNGKYVSLRDDTGAFGEADSIGAWESAQRVGNELLYEANDKGNVITIREYVQ